jgi:NAD(P) transhydrogenase subunit alpha
MLRSSALGLVLVSCISVAAIAVGPSAALAQPREYDDITEFVAPKVEGLEDFSAEQETYAQTSEQTNPTFDPEEAAIPEADGIDRLITFLTIFVLAIFVGFEVITKVPPTLHTPLMSGSNAISGITIIGAILAGVSGNVQGQEFLTGGLAFAAAALAMINVVGGFVVTDRMLQMFRKKDRA